MEGPCYLSPLCVCVWMFSLLFKILHIKAKTIHTQPLGHNSLTHPATMGKYLVLLLLHFTHRFTYGLTDGKLKRQTKKLLPTHNVFCLQLPTWGKKTLALSMTHTHTHIYASSTLPEKTSMYFSGSWDWFMLVNRPNG